MPSYNHQVRKRVPGQAAALPAPAPTGRGHPLAAPAAPPAILAPPPEPALAAQQQRRGLAHALLGGRLAADQGHRLGRLSGTGGSSVQPPFYLSTLVGPRKGDVAVCSHVRNRRYRRSREEANLECNSDRQTALYSFSMYGKFNQIHRSLT